MSETAAPNPGSPEAGPVAAPSVSEREIEVKLVGDSARMERAVQWLAENGAQLWPRATNLYSTYFDTENEALRAADMVLRVRKVRSRHLLTFKWRNPDASNPFERGEVEVRLPGPEPDISLLGEAAADRIREICGDSPLLPRFTTEIKRRVADLRAGLSTIEVAIDRGKVIAGEHQENIEEIEFELVEGELGDVLDLAVRISDACGLTLGAQTKSERGYLLASQKGPKAVRAGAMSLAEDAATEHLIGAILGDTVEQFVANWPGFLQAELPEAVHQMRVGLRRLRAAIKLFQREFPCSEFARFEQRARDIASAMGPARDMDAFIDLVETGPQAALPNDAHYAGLLEGAAKRRTEGYGHVRDILLAPATTRFVLELHALTLRRSWRGALDVAGLGKLSEPAPVFAARTLERLHKRARKRGKDLEHLTPEDRHRLRIAFKDLRYAAEFFAPLYSQKSARQFTRTLSSLQDVFGAYNDTISAHAIVAALETANGPMDRAAGLVLGWCARGAAEAETHLAESWKSFRKVEKFWE
ncbi:CYTH and CHAD domain-containing protein [Roseiarcaceae bacterium H3SJ34-1]|uniref:CYTH and CHAD domain-containing protein n=1 Tax=Terripilifer ovatus TaxID=3032367 RepID=UPI003AB97219|nr:CYTH and CHAD domain-containing protein [Roseiarcaceae bacterium H3SJ34-1]